MSEASASLGELERDLAAAIGRDEKPMAVSLINSLLYKYGTKAETKPRRL